MEKEKAQTNDALFGVFSKMVNEYTEKLASITESVGVIKKEFMSTDMTAKDFREKMKSERERYNNTVDVINALFTLVNSAGVFPTKYEMLKKQG